MSAYNMNQAGENTPQSGKILLALLPYWTPLIPPMGISCLKSYLQAHGFPVTAADANIEEEFKQLYDDYFARLAAFIPADKRGNFYNTGQDVMQNHALTFFNLHQDHAPDHPAYNYPGEQESVPGKNAPQDYFELLKSIIYKHFYVYPQQDDLLALDAVTGKFFAALEKYIVALLQKEQPTVLGLSVFRGTLAASLFAFKLAKSWNPALLTVMGGAVFSQCLAPGSPNFAFFLEKTPYIDRLLIGEGEILFLKLLQNKLPAGRKYYSIQDIAGETVQLDSLAAPDFTDFTLSFYPTMAAYASRSCPFQCGFCAETVYWGNYRKRKAARVADELLQTYRKYGSQMFLMCDSLLNPIIDDLAGELLNRETTLYWDGYLRVEQPVCGAENTLLWRRGGFYRARLGIESGSPRVLAAMNKKITIPQIKSALANLAYAGIKTTTYWVIGYPGESEEDFQQTLELIAELRDDIYEAECNYFHYFPSGQVNSAAWREQNSSVLLYPPQANDLLMVQTWEIAGAPGREEMFSRVNRFVQRCRELGVPNPYSLQEIYEADERWRKLHENAVPALVDFEAKGAYIDEARKVKRLLLCQNPFSEEGDFGFQE